MDLFLIGGYGIAALAFFVIVLCRNDVKLALTLLMGKPKGIKETIIIKNDRTVGIEANTPKANGTIKRGNTPYTINRKSVYFDPKRGVQVVFIREGDLETFDPLEGKEKGIDPQLLENLGYEMYYAGYKAAEKDFQKILWASIAAAGLALLCLAFSFLNFQQGAQVAASVAAIAKTQAVILKPV